MSNEIYSFEVTDILRQKGIRRIERQHETIVVVLDDHDNEKVIRSSIYSSDFNKSMRALKKVCSAFIHDNLVIQEIILIISKMWNELINDKEEDEDSPATNTNASAIYDEIKKDRAANGEVPQGAWRVQLSEKYNNLMRVIDENLPQLRLQIELELSVKSILNIKDCTLPLAVIVLGAPSSLKTQGIELFRKWPYTYYTDNFSARSFVSHNTSVNREQLKEIDLLPKIKNKIFLTPELAPTFASKDDDLVQLLGIITRVVDGHGYFSNSGAHGGRGYEGPMMFVWIGAAVDIPKRVHKYLSTLGPKLYFLRLPKEVYPNPEEEYLKQIKGTDFGTKVCAIHDALFDYLKWVELCPFADIEQSSGIPKVAWNCEDKDDEKSMKYIIRLGRLLAHLRGSVPTWDTSHSQGSEYAYGIATIEEPPRAITQLMNLAKGHALSQGRNFITKEDVSIVIKVVLSTASIERVAVFDLLLAHGGKLQTPVIEESLNVTSPTALRTMTEFKAIGLMDSNKNNGSSHVNEITLKPEFDWFLTTEFRKLRDGYKPEKYTETEEHDKSAGSVVNGNNNSSDGGQSQQETNNYSAAKDDAIKNDGNTSHAFQIYDVPTGDTETLRTGKTIVRCFKGSDLWRCTADKCRVKGDIYMMRSHIY
jgi:hypothetical protein